MDGREAVTKFSTLRYCATTALLAFRRASGAVPGGIAAIGRAGEDPDYVSVGTTAFANSEPVDEQTLWRLYSMTKPITGMAAMLLIAEGDLGLDQPIAEFIPEFANMRVLHDDARPSATRPATTQITVRHLLTHTAGFSYVFKLHGVLRDEYLRLGLTPTPRNRLNRSAPPTAPDLPEFCQRLAALPLIADPGSQWNYSVSLDVLGRIIELASGISFPQFLTSRFFEPLKMDSTYFQVPMTDVRRLSTNYVTVNGETRPVDPAGTSAFCEPPPFAFGGSGLVSCAHDYDRFLRTLLEGGELDGTAVMPAEAVTLGMSNLVPDGVDMGAFIWWPDLAAMGFGPSGDGSGFGAGGRVALSGRDQGSYSWSGSASTTMFVDPARKIRGSAYVNSMSETFTFCVLANDMMRRDADG